MARRKFTPWQPLDARMQGILDRIEALDLRTMTEEEVRAMQEEFKLVGDDEFVWTTLMDEGWMWYDEPAPGSWRRDNRPAEELTIAGNLLQMK
jgi:hypothetical protein